MKFKIAYLVLFLSSLSIGIAHAGESGRSVDTPRFALRSNLLYDAAVTPNIGVEYSFGKAWSVGINGIFAYWGTESSRRCWRVYGGELDFRRYFSPDYSGHHAGIYLQGISYDIAFGSSGYQSDFSYGVGLEYGYKLPLNRSLSLDFEIGVGYFSGEYKKYTKTDDHLVWKKTGRFNWFGPTRAGITLVWNLGSTNHSKKGGEK